MIDGFREYEYFLIHCALNGNRIKDRKEHEYYRTHPRPKFLFASGDFIVGASMDTKYYEKIKPYPYGECGARYLPEFISGAYFN